MVYLYKLFKIHFLLYIFLILCVYTSYAQVSCVNADFSLNNFTNWTGSTGGIKDTLSGYQPIVPGLVIGPPNCHPYYESATLPIGASHTIMNQSGTDPNTENKLSVLPPNGANSVRLGNSRVGYCDDKKSHAEQIKYTYNINSENCIFTYQYAVVLQDPENSSSPHVIQNRPRFTIYVKNSSGEVFDTVCGKYEVTASSNLPGFTTCEPDQTTGNICDGTKDEDVVWKDWSSVSLDLSSYIGQNITIEFATYDCTQTGHFGYAYISCFCSSKRLIQQCINISELLVTAPEGFASYTWSTGATTSSILIPSPVPIGDTVFCHCTTYNGCDVELYAVLDVDPAIVLVSMPNTICAGDTVTITASGNAVSYEWFDGSTSSSIQVTPSATTTYTVTATSAGGCTNTAQTIVTVNPIPIGSVLPIPSNCGNNDGSVSANVTSGTAPYTYSWNTGHTGVTQLSNLSPSTYTVTVTDSKGCSASFSGVVTDSPPIQVVVSKTNENCNQANGTVTAVATGGNGQLTYTWNSVPPQYTATANNLPAGTYIVTVSDGVCPTTASISLMNIPGPTLSVLSVLNATCGKPNGSAILAASNGTPPYTYTWNTTPVQTTSNLQNVIAGTYTVTVTDSKNCKDTETITITSSPPVVAAITNTVPANCGFTNGSLSVTTSSGSPPFSYIWNTSPTQYTPTANGIPPGTYSVIISDQLGCSTMLNGLVPELPGPDAISTSVPELCSNGKGTASVFAAGGYVPPQTYSYVWSTNPPQYNPTAVNLTAGTYTCTVSDGGCSAVKTIMVSNIEGPKANFLSNPHILTIYDDPVQFTDQSTGAIVNWYWTMGDGSSNTNLTEFEHPYPNVGTYPVMLVVTDTNGCKDTANDVIIVKDIFTIYIPNAFTPTEDGKNEFFFPKGINWDPDYFEMYIFDRWGNIMFKSFDQNNMKWDGTLNNDKDEDHQFIDVYVYLIRVKEIDGPKHQFIGRVTLLK